MIAFNDLFQFSPLPMWVYDAKTLNFLTVNNEAIRAYGYNLDEFLTMRADMLLNEGDIETCSHIKKNGEIIIVSIHSNTIDYEGAKAILVIAADITAQVKAERVLKLNEQKLKVLVEDGLDMISIMTERFNVISKATSDTVWDWNLATDKLVWNKGIKGIFGYKDLYDNSTTGDWRTMKIHADDRERVMDDIKMHIREKVARWQSEYRFCCADGSYKYVHDRGFMVFDEVGVSIRMIGSMQDISLRKQEEQWSKKHLKEIEEQNKKFREIAWIQSHLVRAPLARVMGLVDLLKNFVPGEDKDELLLHLTNSAKELDAIIINIADKTPKSHDQYPKKNYG